MNTHLDILSAVKRGENTYWTRIGTAFPTKEGKGYRLSLDYFPVSPGAEFILLPPKERSSSSSFLTLENIHLSLLLLSFWRLPMSKPSSPRADVYQRVTDQIISAIEAGAGSWQMPWHSDSPSLLPINIETGKRYRGINILDLWAASYHAGFPQPIWGTFKQWSDVGHSVKKGEKASVGVFWKPLQCECDTDQSVENEDGTPRQKWVARAFPLFNCAQVDGYEVPPRPIFPLQSA
jgi:hypothetical protein